MSLWLPAERIRVLSRKNDFMILAGREKLYTENPGVSYLVKEGSVRVYAAFSDGENERRALPILRAQPGTVIPGIVRKTAGGGVCRLLVIPEKNAELEELPFESAHAAEFFKAAGVECAEASETYPELLERFYQKETERENDVILDRELSFIYDRSAERESFTKAFDRSFIGRYAGQNASDYSDISKASASLHKALMLICGIRHIDIAPVQELKEAFGSSFTVSDIAFLSGFTAREVILDGKTNWEDVAPLVIFPEEGRPLAVFVRFGILWYYEPKSGKNGRLKSLKLDREEIPGITIIRPLKNSTLDFKGIIDFSLREIRIRDILTFLISVGLVTMFSLIPSLLNEYVFSDVIPTGLCEELFPLAVYVVSMMLGGMLFSIARGLTLTRITGRIRAAVQTAAYDRLFHLKESDFRGSDPAAISFKTEFLPDTFTTVFTALAETLVMIVMAAVYAIRMNAYSPFLTAVSSGFVLVNVVTSIALGLLFRNRQIAKSRLMMKNRYFLLDTITGVETIRSFGVAERFGNIYMKYLTDYGKAELNLKRSGRLSVFISSVTSAFSVIAVYALTAFGNAVLTKGQLFAFLSLIGSFSGAMVHVASDVLMFTIMIPVLQNAFDIFSLPRENSPSGKILRDFEGNIRVENISFAYDNSREPALFDVSMDVRAGEYIGITGTSGCGKSTLIRLLLGFERPMSGRIYYDGIDLDRLNKAFLRKKIGTVLQNGTLFSGTIASNISISPVTDDIEAVKAAAEQACIAEYIESLPMKYDTILSENGENVSGGIAQRILIARALAGDPKVLILDEATSALDNITQAEVCSTLRNSSATKIVISHRLSTLEKCDRVYVMDRGRIAECGTVTELLEKKGLFYELSRRQQT